jgi:hypothetical protein
LTKKELKFFVLSSLICTFVARNYLKHYENKDNSVLPDGSFRPDSHSTGG